MLLFVVFFLYSILFFFHSKSDQIGHPQQKARITWQWDGMNEEGEWLESEICMSEDKNINGSEVTQHLKTNEMLIVACWSWLSFKTYQPLLFAKVSLTII